MSLVVDIRKRLGSFSLNVAFEADREVLAILGSSGCGKSMTLKCIAGIERPDEGFISLDGRVLFDSKKKINLTPQKRRVGYLFQQYALFPNMTVRDNIAAGVRKNVSRRDDIVAAQIRAMHLEGLERTNPVNSPADSSSARPLPAFLQTSRSLSCWTSLFPRWTVSSNGSWKWNFPTR